ncbi:hypothetical protein NM208_g6372 [Fusarium decemcellulare]|uniref:Uncharacterized protein n=1 Tax=Fusarium decemcellulare TaxID=57161 RepID=A0ACC1SDL1_9HYPO|nr:hypothetical protein NM208_g6372 [Fusarium decemcellulare]
MVPRDVYLARALSGLQQKHRTPPLGKDDLSFRGKQKRLTATSSEPIQAKLFYGLMWQSPKRGSACLGHGRHQDPHLGALRDGNGKPALGTTRARYGQIALSPNSCLFGGGGFKHGSSPANPDANRESYCASKRFGHESQEAASSEGGGLTKDSQQSRPCESKGLDIDTEVVRNRLGGGVPLFWSGGLELATGESRGVPDQSR